MGGHQVTGLICNMDAKCIISAILWLLLLIFVAWPVAGFCAAWYILLSPIKVVLMFLLGDTCSCLESIIKLLHQGVCWPESCAQKMVEGSSDYQSLGCGGRA